MSGSNKEMVRMEFFGHMRDIKYHEYSQLIEAVESCRHNMLDADCRLLCHKVQSVHLDEDFALSNGRIDIEYQRIKFECFFYYRQNTPLYVFLNGALTQQRPQFSRWSYYKFVDGSILNIADPMYRMYEELVLGWYYGNKDLNLRICISEIVKKIAAKIGVANEDIIFYGSSGGGAAVIECASYLSGSKAVCINPQIILSEYFYADIFERITSNCLMRDDRWYRNNALYYLQNNNGSTHLILINIRCESDMLQANNICKAVGIEIKYGLNVFGSLLIWLYDCNCEPYVNAHDIQDNFYMFFAIKKVLESMDNHMVLEQIDSFCRYVNEWWNAWWQRELYWRSRQPNLHYLIECTKLSRKIALFGTGMEAQRLCSELLGIPGENYYDVQVVFDNDENKWGNAFNGYTVLNPNQICDWQDYFVIICSSKYVTEIKQQLEDYGLVCKRDFITLKDLYL